MPTSRFRTRPLVIAGLAACAALPLAASFDLSWHTVDGGGAMFTSGGNFELSGTAGQPDPGVMSGGDFELVGGFWAVTLAEPTPCPGDLDGDLDVDLSDLTLLLQNFQGDGVPSPGGDLDGDGDTDLGDLTLLLQNFGVVCN